MHDDLTQIDHPDVSPVVFQQYNYRLGRKDAMVIK
jgi:hypothetical protein